MPNYQAIQSTGSVLMWALGVIIAVGGAAAVVAKMFSPFRKVQAKLKKHDELLDNDKRKLDEHEESMKLVLRAQMTLIDHELTGNSVDRLREVKNDINAYLINR